MTDQDDSRCACPGGCSCDGDGEPCGCDFVQFQIIDGRQVEIHHVIPDDFAQHAETSDCGCGPQRHEISDSLVVYDHVDQDPTDLLV